MEYDSRKYLEAELAKQKKSLETGKHDPIWTRRIKDSIANLERYMKEMD